MAARIVARDTKIPIREASARRVRKEVMIWSMHKVEVSFHCIHISLHSHFTALTMICRMITSAPLIRNKKRELHSSTLVCKPTCRHGYMGTGVPCLLVGEYNIIAP